jgi:hypothetical protein
MVLLHGPLAPAMRLGSTQRAERRKHLHAPVLLGVLLLLPLLESRPTGASSNGAGPLAADGPAALVPKTWDISRFGAVGDGKTNNTAVVRAAAAALREAGGGVLLFPKGNWVTGSFNLSSNSELRIEGKLIGIEPKSVAAAVYDYPVINSMPSCKCCRIILPVSDS